MGGHKMNLWLRKWLVGLIVLVGAIVIACSCGPVNHSPVINSLKADKMLVLPSETVNIECNATSIAGGNLTYNWSVSGGVMRARASGESGGWTAPGEPGNCTVTVNVTDEYGGETTGSIIITVRTNGPPIITNLTVCEDWVVPSGNCQLECQAEDPDNDQLTYKWEAAGGNITGEGSIANWTAPQQPGSYNITVLVEDSMGGMSTTSVTIDVGVNHPPVIESLTAEKTKILMATSCNIDCIASDPDNDKLSYSWSIDAGNISGSGSDVKWTAPPRGGQFIITATVSDGRGGATSKEVLITVVTCSCSL
jgi:hypothetical protein